jgi:hypothetical protein
MNICLLFIQSVVFLWYSEAVAELEFSTWTGQGYFRGSIDHGNKMTVTLTWHLRSMNESYDCWLEVEVIIHLTQSSSMWQIMWSKRVTSLEFFNILWIVSVSTSELQLNFSLSLSLSHTHTHNTVLTYWRDLGHSVFMNI